MKKLLYQFLGIHSLLIGLFGFFIPVFLWNLGYSLADISFFISVSGLSFLISLFIWDKVRKNKDIKYIIICSFLLEILLITSGYFTNSLFFLYLLAILYGAYDCFFWVTKRVLFLEDSNEGEMGNKFGNVIIIAFVLAKVGIFIGAFLIESYSYLYLLFFTVFICIFGIILTLRLNNKDLKNINRELKKEKVVSVKKIIHFRDKSNSKTVFFTDGPFLFFESFYWMITLFLISNESFQELSYLVIFLALSFAISFVGLKNTIDRLDAQKVYTFSIILYFFSWLLRGITTNIDSTLFLYINIFVIAFFTSFFRLSFNKEFFTIAKNNKPHLYTMCKSYYSQFSVFVTFLIIGLLFKFNLITLNNIYYIASLFSIFYLFYILKSYGSSKIK